MLAARAEKLKTKKTKTKQKKEKKKTTQIVECFAADASTLQAAKRNAIFGQKGKRRMSGIHGESKMCKMIFVYEDDDAADAYDVDGDVGVNAAKNCKNVKW